MDTGADISLIAKEDVPQGVHIVRAKCSAKTYTGTTIGIIGTAEIKFKIFNTESSAVFHVTDTKYSEHLLLGTNWISKYITTLEKLVQLQVKKTTKQSNTREMNIANTSVIQEENSDNLEAKTKQEFTLLFNESLKNQMPCSITEHRIETTGNQAITQKAYPVPLQFEKRVRAEIQKLLDQNIIRHSKSEWSSSIVVAEKANGSLRLCLDYRNLNSITIKDSYPLPNINEVIDSLSNAGIFSILDATSGYYQFNIAEADRKKTAFRFKGGFYEFVRMPFGLCNAPATFQRAMDTILQGINGEFVIPYLDDIIIFSKNKHEHQKHIRIVLGKLQEHNIILNPAKCKFYRSEIKFLGRLISKGIVKPDPDKISSIQNFEYPKTIKELRSFLGLLNFCREFIPSLSRKAHPLFTLLEGEKHNSNKSLNLTEMERNVFKSLKKELSDDTLRYQPDMEKEFIVVTDASDYALGGLLIQRNDKGQEQIVHSFSKTLVGAEKNYSTTDKELLAIIKSLAHFRKYLLGKEFTLKTDHRALSYLWKTENLEGRLMRWSLKLQDYKFKIEYIKGETNAADILSRNVREITESKQKTQEKPREQQTDMLELTHRVSGHGGASTMKFLLRDTAWKGMHKEVEEYIKQCETCQKAGGTLLSTKHTPLTTNNPNELWEVDLLGRIEDKDKKNYFILVCIDHFTKWIYVRLLANKTTEKVKEALEDIINENKRAPQRIYSDNGKEFIGKVLTNWASENKIAWEFCSPYHHQSIGCVERTNRTLWNKIRLLSNFGEFSWKRALQKAAFAINISFNRSIGTSPYEARYGNKPDFGINGLPMAQPSEITTLETIRMHKQKYMEEIAKGHLKIERNIPIGSHVFIYKLPKGKPLEETWEKGYKVMRYQGRDAYIVSNGIKEQRLNKIHVKLDVTS
ncbi:hypothetical protein ENBRE01_2411 [Enteropsectra breve]|nr:hypothetical protein ENBRE01_2411 [Enteropsectra breve]